MRRLTITVDVDDQMPTSPRGYTSRVVSDLVEGRTPKNKQIPVLTNLLDTGLAYIAAIEEEI